jgi:enoyl-CoA hydratase
MEETINMTEKMGLKETKYEKKGMIAFVAYDTDGHHNMYTNSTLQELARIWKDYEADHELRCAILYGENKSFCAGHNLFKGEAISSEPPTLHKREIRLKKPIIAAVGGYALGGGFSTALACDMMICADDAKMGIPQAKYGLSSMGGPQLIPRIIPGVARWYLYTGENITGPEAYRLGMCLKCVPRETLIEEATKMAEKICESSPDSIRYLKESLEVGQNLPIDIALPVSITILKGFEHTAEYKANMQALMEKKDPPFKPKKKSS